MFQRIIRLEYINKFFVLNFLCGRLRNQNNIFHSIRENYISHTATAQHRLLIGENSTHTYRTGRLINNTTDSINSTLFRIYCSISQLQFHGRHFFQLVFQCTACLSHGKQLFFSHRKIDIHITDFAYSSKRLSHRWTYQTSYTIRECSDYAIRRTCHSTKIQILCGTCQLCLCLCQTSFSREQLIYCTLIFKITDDILIMQIFLLLFIQCQGINIRLSHLHGRTCLAFGSRILCRVYLKQSLAFANCSTLIYTQFHNKARHLRTYLDILNTLDSGRI